MINVYHRGGVESNEFGINLYQLFPIIFKLSNQLNFKFSNRIERISNQSNFWKFDSTLWLESNWTNRIPINFIEFFEYFFPFCINQIKWILNEFQFDSTLVYELTVYASKLKLLYSCNIFVSTSLRNELKGCFLRFSVLKIVHHLVYPFRDPKSSHN